MRWLEAVEVIPVLREGRGEEIFIERRDIVYIPIMRDEESESFGSDTERCSHSMCFWAWENNGEMGNDVPEWAQTLVCWSYIHRSKYFCIIKRAQEAFLEAIEGFLKDEIKIT